MTRIARLLPLLLLCLAPGRSPAAPRVQVLPIDYASRVDVQIDGQPFTSYVHLAAMRIPALTPIRDARGRTVSGELVRADGVGGRTWTAGGLLFAHGNVNGVDFSLQPRGGVQTGHIALRRIIEAVSGEGEGRLSLEADWLGPGDALLLKEHTWLLFKALPQGRTIERVSRLSAVRGRVTLGDSQAPALILLVADGLAAAPAAVRSAEGPLRLQPDETVESRWVALSSGTGARRSTIALFDHPENPGFPGRADARRARLSYRPAVPIEIEAGTSRTWWYRVAIGGWDPLMMERELGAYGRQPR